MEGLPANTLITVFLTEAREPGGLPAQFLGEFWTDDDGKGELEVKTEIVNAFASSNPIADTDDDGVVTGRDDDGNRVGHLPGTAAPGTAITHALNWFRGYLVGGSNVFGIDENTPGAGPVFIHKETESPL